VDDGAVLAFIGTLLLTGFLLEGLRLAATERNPSSSLFNPGAARWSPAGYLFSLPFTGAGLGAWGMQVAHFVLWWLHAALMTAAFVYAALSFSRFTHILVSPANAFLRSARPLGALRPEAVRCGQCGHLNPLVESACVKCGASLALPERFGARELTDLTWKQLLDLDACTNCGRCQDQCPAWASGKPLSPRKLVQDLRAYMEGQAPVLLRLRPGEAPPPPERRMVQEAVTEEVLWACTTCRACMEACPVSVEHLDTIVEMRRHLVMEQAQVPEGAAAALRSLGERGHPWRGTSFSRTDWAQGLGVKTLSAGPQAEVLLWVGCASAFDPRSQRVARALVQVLQAAGVPFAILGEEEVCTGDPARRMGDEYLYQQLARQNIETFQRHGVRRVLTLCPHCFNTLKNEYPQLGGQFEVLHYTQFVAELLRAGRLRPSKAVATTLAYHDSCYLGRHNGVYEEPRQIARAIPGLELVEMAPHHRERGFCCGAGGGRMWMEEKGVRVSHVRTEHFLKTGAKTLGVSCPFCLQMLTEGVAAKGAGGEKQAADLLELLAQSL
jgi:Fe-S oxidoreductase